MSRLARVPALLLWLTVLWVALWGDPTVGNVIGGLVVAVGVLAVARPTGVSGFTVFTGGRFHPMQAVVYALYFLKQLITSNLIVAWEIITPGSKLRRGIIEVPMHSRSAAVVTLVANSITLTPGTITLDVHEHEQPDGSIRRVLFVHVLQLGDVASAARDVLTLERRAIKAFGTAAELVDVERTLAALEHSTSREAAR